MSLVQTGMAARFFSAVLAENRVHEYLRMGIGAHLFINDGERAIYEFVDKHVRSHGALPKPETVESHIGVKLKSQKEPASYYLEGLLLRFQETQVETTLAEVSKVLQDGGEKAAPTALKLFGEAANASSMAYYAANLVDMRVAAADALAAYNAKKTGQTVEGIVTTGWGRLDTISGGYRAGDLISIAARPGVGKSWCLLWQALKAWSEGKTVLFVSMEMNIELVRERVAALISALPYQKLKEGTLSPEQEAVLAQVANVAKGMNSGFYVVDGNLSANVQDIEALTRQFRPDAIYIDGGYLLRHPTERDRYKRVAENVDLIKQRLAIHAPTVVTWQLKRNDRKEPKEPDEYDLEDIAYADAIGQASSLVLAVFDPIEGVNYEYDDTDATRLIRILKGRSGEIGDFSIYWRFKKTTDFDEVPPASISLTAA